MPFTKVEVAHCDRINSQMHPKDFQMPVRKFFRKRRFRDFLSKYSSCRSILDFQRTEPCEEGRVFVVCESSSLHLFLLLFFLQEGKSVRRNV